MSRMKIPVFFCPFLYINANSKCLHLYVNVYVIHMYVKKNCMSTGELLS